MADYRLNRDDTIAFAPKDLQKLLTPVMKAVPDPTGGIFADAQWTKSKTKQWVIKISEQNFKHIKTVISGVEKQKDYNVELGDYKIQFHKSGMKAPKGGVSNGAADAKTTQMQERGSAWIFSRVFKDGVRYNKYEDILNDPQYKQLEAIYPNVPEEWIKVFFLQQKTLFDKFKGSKFTEFVRDGGFMAFITQLVREKYRISQKDNWNPADIWLVKNETKVVEDIKKVTDKGTVQSLEELNTLLRTMFKERRVVGISLKKVSGKTAVYEEVNVDGEQFVDSKHYAFTLSFTDIKFNPLFDATQGKFATQDSRVIITNGPSETYNFQIKANDSTILSNLKWEPTQKGYGAARIGKAPVAMVLDALKQYGINFTNSYKDYPQTEPEFMKQVAKYNQMFSRVKQATQNTTTVQAFTESMRQGFIATPHVAVSKLMQLDFLYQVCSIREEDSHHLFTDILFLSMKKGAKFGPFGKLY